MGKQTTLQSPMLQNYTREIMESEMWMITVSSYQTNRNLTVYKVGSLDTHIVR